MIDYSIKWKLNNLRRSSKDERKELISFLNDEETKKVRSFHKSFPQYKVTPLVKLDALAEEIGLGSIYLKDESYRFGLNAFKVLGASFAMARYLATKLGKDISELDFPTLISDETMAKLGDITFVTATDGNHGRGVAWMARQLNQKSVVYMPANSSETRLNNILSELADASITDVNYDECVRMADAYAKAHNGVVIQDTAWEGYEEIPMWIMQGYTTMAKEALEQIRADGVDMPTHIFVQAGVGSLAGAVQGTFATMFGDDGPKITVVESNLADCLYKSAVVGDGEPHFVDGEMETLMAGLACGEPNITGWEILKNFTTCFISSPDWVAANGMRILAAPLGDDKRLVSGESGAVTTGMLYEIMTNDKLKGLKQCLGLDENSKVLLFSTEGDTDPEIYRQMVWRGRNKK